MVLLNESKDVFTLGKEPTPFVKHFINTGDHPSVSTASYRLFPNRKELLWKEIDNLLADMYQKQVEKDRASRSKDMGIGSDNEPRKDYSAEAFHDSSPVNRLISPRPRSYIPSNKRNERTNYYDSNRKYVGEKKRNFYHHSNLDTRKREKYNNKNQNYQDARRQNYDSEVNNKSDCAQILNESLNGAFESISPSDKECFQNNQPECDDKDESKRQDICAGNSSWCIFLSPEEKCISL
ncbi:hypothetical protein TNCV_1959791 [Trichonephila clavipes]|nr:hypothetical protein TNCV_1959791 [Trichonephila clavipes]